MEAYAGIEKHRAGGADAAKKRLGLLARKAVLPEKVGREFGADRVPGQCGASEQIGEMSAEAEAALCKAVQAASERVQRVQFKSRLAATANGKREGTTVPEKRDSARCALSAAAWALQNMSRQNRPTNAACTFFCMRPPKGLFCMLMERNGKV